MSCSFTEQISALIDGELPAAEAGEVERHLQTCADCQYIRAEFLQLRTEINSQPLAVDSAATHQALAQVRSQQRPQSQHTKPIDWRGLLIPKQASAFALAALAIIGIGTAIVLFSYQQGNNNVAVIPTMVTPHEGPHATSSPTPTPEKVVNPNPPKDSGKSEEDREQRRRVPRIQRPENYGIAASKGQPPGLTATSNAATANTSAAPLRPADTGTLTAQHLEQAELLLRSFRNLRPRQLDDLNHQRRRAQQLFYQNVMLRREADHHGDVQVATLLDRLEPILLDIANLPTGRQHQELDVIKARVERKNLVALLQVNSIALARINE